MKQNFHKINLVNESLLIPFSSTSNKDKPMNLIIETNPITNWRPSQTADLRNAASGLTGTEYPSNVGLMSAFQGRRSTPGAIVLSLVGLIVDRNRTGGWRFGFSGSGFSQIGSRRPVWFHRWSLKGPCGRFLWVLESRGIRLLKGNLWAFFSQKGSEKAHLQVKRARMCCFFNCQNNFDKFDN